MVRADLRDRTTSVCEPAGARAMGTTEPPGGGWSALLRWRERLASRAVRGGRVVAGASCACETCGEVEPRVKACSLAVAERSRRSLLVRTTGLFVGVQWGIEEGQCTRGQSRLIILVSLLCLLAVVACVPERIRSIPRAPTFGPRSG
jgi:hypothetical protein